MTEEEERKRCTTCGDYVLVNKDGKLRRHQRWRGSGKYGMPPRWEPCPGREAEAQELR
jgi:hypothetical protein